MDLFRFCGLSVSEMETCRVEGGVSDRVTAGRNRPQLRKRKAATAAAKRENWIGVTQR